jgi:hypothetical protein
LLNNKLTGMPFTFLYAPKKRHIPQQVLNEISKWSAVKHATSSTPPEKKTKSTRNSRQDHDSILPPSKTSHAQQTQYDNLKRKTILAPNTLATAAANEAAHQLSSSMNRNSPVDQQQQRMANLGDIAGGMDANRVRHATSYPS